VLYPKGGHGAFPAVFAARMLNIPVIIHESDSYPGRVNLWSGKFAKNVGLAYKDARRFF
jgi:UDP-N-acetylglucosamine--N-acetylmuramyl-(pentapeptide) pyrophosphoryl-undecaprenol N-acetylglucosamine transferase